MQTFGRLRMDVENCIRELVGFGVARQVSGTPQRYSAARPDNPGIEKLLDRYRQSVLNAAVKGELTREWRERHLGELETGEALLQRVLQARRQAWEKAELARMQARGGRSADDQWRTRYVPPEAPNAAIAAAIVDLLGDTSARAEIMQRAPEVLARYHWQLTAADTIKVIEEAAVGR